MYTILVNEDNSLYGSKKEVIMQRSKLADKLCFIVHSIYKDIDMTDASVVLEYLLPVSKKYKTEYLVLSEERYKDCYLQYKLPFDTELTSPPISPASSAICFLCRSFISLPGRS